MTAMPAAPESEAASPRPLLRWCLDRTRRHIARHGARLTQGGGRLGDLYVSVDEVAAVLADRPTADVAAELGLPPAADPGPVPRPDGSPLARIADRFALEPTDVALLAAAAGSALWVDVARLYAFAWADFAVKLPPASFLAELVSDTADDALAAMARLRPDGPLRRGGLVRLEAPEAWGRSRAPFAHHGVIVPDPVLALLRGEPPLVLDRAALRAPDDDPPPFDAPPAAAERLDRLLAHGGPIVLVGPPGSGRAEAARHAARRRGQPLLDVDLDRLPRDPAAFDGALLDLLLDARLRALPLLVRLGRPAEDDPRGEPLRRRLAAHRGPLLITAERAPDGLGDAPLVELTRPDSAEQRALWLRELADDARADRLAARFDVTPGVLLAALAEARREARALGAEAPDDDQITRALRRRMQHALDGLSERVHTALGWDDVVLPDDVVERLREIRAHARHRSRVFDTWGFRRKMDYGRGLSCLFSGPPGTGKTMMAGIIAHDLGRELYRVDLSRVVSKWVGETEKNLGRIFDEAEQAQVILFFDEADSLFSTRTEVKGANDRFANMEVNYLLQRMEQYDGVSILTTNFERGLDEAFRRRLKFRVHFPLPDADQRAELWRRMIPAEMPVDGDIDFERLGRKHKMSGGNIKNAVLRAAFYAAEEGGGLTLARLRRAADAESREMGRL